jgi:hypothetical protein
MHSSSLYRAGLLILIGFLCVDWHGDGQHTFTPALISETLVDDITYRELKRVHGLA